MRGGRSPAQCCAGRATACCAEGGEGGACSMATLLGLAVGCLKEGSCACLAGQGHFDFGRKGVEVGCRWGRG